MAYTRCNKYRNRKEQIIMESLRYFLEEHEMEMILSLLQKEEKRLKRLAEMPIRGYGSVESMMKKDGHRNKAEELEQLQNKLAQLWD